MEQNEQSELATMCGSTPSPLRKPMLEDFGLTQADVDAAHSRRKCRQDIHAGRVFWASNVTTAIVMLLLFIAYPRSTAWLVVGALLYPVWMGIFGIIISEAPNSDSNIFEKYTRYNDMIMLYERQCEVERIRDRRLSAKSVMERQIEVVNAFASGEIHRYSYSEYLQTDHWRRLRKNKIRSAGKRCAICGASGNLQVHHKHYNTLGRERPCDLMVVCRYCHEKIHDMA